MAVVLVNIHLMIKFPPLASTMYYPVPELFEIRCIADSIIYLDWYPKLSFGMY